MFFCFFFLLVLGVLKKNKPTFFFFFFFFFKRKNGIESPTEIKAAEMCMLIITGYATLPINNSERGVGLS